MNLKIYTKFKEMCAPVSSLSLRPGYLVIVTLSRSVASKVFLALMWSDVLTRPGLFICGKYACLRLRHTLSQHVTDTIVVDWRGYHRVGPVDNLPWRCSRRHGTCQQVPATLTRRLMHIMHMNHTSRGARKTARPRQLSKDHLSCRWSAGFQLSTGVTFQRSWYHVLLVRLSGSVSSNLAVLPVNAQSYDVTGP